MPESVLTLFLRASRFCGILQTKGNQVSTNMRVPPDTRTTTFRHGIPRQLAVVDGRVRPSAIDDVVRQIVERFRPRRVVLFGSYADGQPHAGSDIDLLVEMDTALTETEQALEICRAIDYHFGLDLIVRRPETVTSRLAAGDLFLREVMERGRVLYDAAHS